MKIINIPLPIIDEKLYVLDNNGIPVCMAGYTREMQNAIGVARLSQMALDKGFNKCVLYTDLLNPTSNSIYQKLHMRRLAIH